MTTKTLRLSKIKLDILRRAAYQSYITDRTYATETRWLWMNGFLASYVKYIRGENCVISGCYEITEKGQAALGALEGDKQGESEG